MNAPKGRYVKANALVNAAYKLTVAEQRVLIMALMQADARTITDQQLYRVKASDLMLYTKSDLKTTVKTLKAAAEKLENRRVVFYETPEGRPRQLVRASWVQTSRFEDETNSVYLRFNHDMLPYINRLTRRFTIVYMSDGPEHYSLSLSSNFSYRLLEMMSQWVDRGWFEIEPEILKRTFALTTQYKNNAELKRRVIDKAVEEINEKTAWSVSYECETKGAGGRIVNFIFRFKVPPLIKQSRQQQKVSVSDQEIQRHARKGETYEQVKERLIKTKKEIERLKRELTA